MAVQLRDLQVTVEDPHRAVVESVTVDGDTATASLRAGVLPGATKVRVTGSGFAAQAIAFHTVLDSSDAIGDGTPDFLRLHDPADRVAFRRWFTFLAEAQYFRGRALPAEIDDCAALLRFAYREALRPHDAVWAHQMALPAPASASDIQQYQYPYTPLAAALFRVRGGSFQANDLRDGAFAQFADVETLWRHNTHFVGHDLARARPGDLLFFRQDASRMPFHAMIFLGQSQIEHGNEQYVVYHTGPKRALRGRNSPARIAAAFELSRPTLAAARRQSRLSGCLSLEHLAGSGLMRLKSAFVAVLLCHALVLPLFAQNDADTDNDAGQSFSLTSQRTYMPGEKPEVSVYSHNVKALEFRVYRVNDPVKFFSQMQELHNFGGQAPALPKQAHTWLEKFHAWKHRIWAWIRDFVRAQFSADSRQKIRLWEMGGGAKRNRERRLKATRKCRCSISSRWSRFGSGRCPRMTDGRAKASPSR